MNDNSHIDLVISETHGFIFVYKSLLATPWSVLYLKLGIGSRIFDVGLVQLDVQPAQLSRAVQGNLGRGFTAQFVINLFWNQPTWHVLPALGMCSWSAAQLPWSLQRWSRWSPNKRGNAASSQLLLSGFVRKCWQPALKILTGREFSWLAMLL